MELSVRFARLEMKAMPDRQNVTEIGSQHLLSLARGLDALQIHTACEAGRRGGALHLSTHKGRSRGVKELA